MSNSVLLEVDCQNMANLLNTLDSLRKNNINYNILQNPIATAPVGNHPFMVNKTIVAKKMLGKKGQDVIRLLAKGYSYQEIADELDVSINGVRYYIKKSFKALNVDNGRDAVRIYLTEMQDT